MKPYYEHDGITIYHGDYREVLGVLPKVDLVLADPPYGVAWDTDTTRFSGGQKPNGRMKQRAGGVPHGRPDWGPVKGDEDDFDPECWLSYPHVVLWGANHYAQRLPRGTWYVWIKKADHLFGTFLSDCELAWVKGGAGVYAIRKQFPPPARIAETGSCVHPCQKPAALMRWCIERSKATGTILDPFMGSGTTLRAAKDLGRKAIGIEIEERYCEIAAKRLAQGVLPFAEKQP